MKAHVNGGVYLFNSNARVRTLVTIHMFIHVLAGKLYLDSFQVVLLKYTLESFKHLLLMLEIRFLSMCIFKAGTNEISPRVHRFILGIKVQLSAFEQSWLMQKLRQDRGANL